VVAANELEAPEDSLKEIENTGSTGISVPGNVSDEASVRRIVEAVVGELERVDVLVNNVGVSLITPAEETTSAESPRQSTRAAPPLWAAFTCPRVPLLA
jgi:NAD(P)-dependent dehydrogenase (short-subunit alcohol dehydrogenase family)